MPNSQSPDPSLSVTVQPAAPPEGQPDRRTPPQVNLNMPPAQGTLGFVGRAFTWANSTALVVLIVFFFRADKRSEDNTQYMREFIARQESRFDKYTDRQDVRYDAMTARTEASMAKAEARQERSDAKTDAVSSELRSLTNSVTALASEVRASRQKAEAAGHDAPLIVGRAKAKDIRPVYRETAPMPRAAGGEG